MSRQAWMTDLVMSSREGRQREEASDPALKGLTPYTNSNPGTDVMDPRLRELYRQTAQFNTMAERGEIATVEEEAVDPVAEQDHGGVWVEPEGDEDIPDLNELKNHEGFMGDARAMYEAFADDKPGNVTDEQIADWAVNEMTGMNWNTMHAIGDMLKYKDIKDPAVAKAVLNVMNMYDWSSNTWGNAGRSTVHVLSDPVTWAGFGVAAGVRKFVGGTLAKSALKQFLTKMITPTTVKGAAGTVATAGAIEGASIGAIDDLVRQYTEKSAEMRKEIDPTRVASMGAIGGLAGAAFGGVMGGAGKKVYDWSRKSRSSLGPPDPEARAAEMAEDFVRERVRKEDFGEETDELASKVLTQRIHDEFGEGKDELVSVATARMQEMNTKLREGPDLGEGEDILTRMTDIMKEEGSTLSPTNLKPRSGGTLGAMVRIGDDVWEITGATASNGWYHLTRQSDGQVMRKHGVNSLRTMGAELIAKRQKRTRFGTIRGMFDEDTAYILDLADGEVKRESRPRPKTVKRTKIEENEVEELMGGKIRAAHWTPEEASMLATRVRKLGDMVAAQAKTLAARLDDPVSKLNVRPEELAAFNVLHSKYKTLRDMYRGVSSDANAVLRGLKNSNFDDELATDLAIKKGLDLQGGIEGSEQTIRRLSEGAGKGGGNRRGLAKASDDIWGKVYGVILTARYNFMLSSWRSHMANIIGSASTGLWEYGVLNTGKLAVNNLEHFFRQAVGGKPMTASERYTLSTWKSELNGMINGTREGFILAKTIMAGGAIPEHLGVGKVANEVGLRYDVTKFPSSTAGKLGTIPVRLLDAEDSFFKAIYYNSFLSNAAERIARQETIGMGPIQFQKRFNHWMAEPTDEMVREAGQHAQRLTFTNDPSIYGSIIGGLAKAASGIQQKSKFFNFMIPFVRTPANIIGYSMDMVMANPQTWGKVYKQITQGTPIERADAISRMGIAAGLFYSVKGLWEEQIITGQGPSNPDVRRTWEATGWRPNSVLINGKYHSLLRIEPMGLALNIIATTQDYFAELDAVGVEDKELSDTIGGGVLYIADMLLDRSWLSSTADLISSISSNDIRGAHHELAGSALSYVIPNFIRDFREMADTGKREMEFRGFQDRITKQLKNASPYWSKDLPARISWDGTYAINDGSPLWNGMVPIRLSEKKIDPAAAALANARIPLQKPGSRLAMNRLLGVKMDLMRMDDGKGFVYQRFQMEVGEMRAKAVNKVVNSSAFKKLANLDPPQIGPNSKGAIMLREAVTIGTRAGKGKFLKWVKSRDSFAIEDGQRTINITHQFTTKEYSATLKDTIRAKPPEGETPQYLIRQPTQPFPKF